MSKNYITDNQELEEFEKYLKSLSKELQTKYKEEGKYLYMRTATKTVTAILCLVLNYQLLAKKVS